LRSTGIVAGRIELQTDGHERNDRHAKRQRPGGKWWKMGALKHREAGSVTHTRDKWGASIVSRPDSNRLILTS
jgi:hypothetical protein